MFVPATAEHGVCREGSQTQMSRGSKSRNKVSVGEPSEGSFSKVVIASPRKFNAHKAKINTKKKKERKKRIVRKHGTRVA